LKRRILEGEFKILEVQFCSSCEQRIFWDPGTAFQNSKNTDFFLHQVGNTNKNLYYQNPSICTLTFQTLKSNILVKGMKYNSFFKTQY
jgi:hypothetical protein